MAWPTGVPLTRCAILGISTAFDEPARSAVTGTIVVTPDHDRVILTTTPPTYVDDAARTFPIGDGGFTVVSSDCPGTTWDNVRYTVTLKVSIGSGGELTLPAKTLFLSKGTLTGSTWSTPVVDYWLATPDTGSGSPAAAGSLADIQTDRTPWAAATAYAAGSNVTQAGGFYTALRAIGAASTFTPSDGWWLTGHDQNVV